MVPTRATVAGEPLFSNELDTTVAPGITGMSFCGKPEINVPTVADGAGLADAVAEALPVEEAVDDAADAGAEPAGPGEPELHAGTARTTAAATSARPSVRGWALGFTGICSFGVRRRMCLQSSQCHGIELRL